MDISIRDALLQHRWKREWFNETETTARIESRSGIPCFVPCSLKHRIFHWHRYISIRNFLGAKGTRIKYSSALSQDVEFLGLIDSNIPSPDLTARFPWDRFLLVDFFGYPQSVFDQDHHWFGVTHEEKGDMWKVRTTTLTWTSEVFVRFPDNRDAT